jgi:hypothetical protein
MLSLALILKELRFSFLFNQKFQDLVNYDLMKMFKDWYIGELGLFRLNFSLLTFIPKEHDASII